MTSARTLLAATLSSALLSGLGGCSLPGSGGCGHVDPWDREGPSGYVAMDAGSYSTERFRPFAVFMPAGTGRVRVTSGDPHIVRLDKKARLQPGKPLRWATTAWPDEAGRTTLRMTTDSGRTYRLRVKVAC